MLAPDTLVLDGRFRVLRSLGVGGMGEVYLGEQVSLERKVAIKVLHHDLHLQPGMLERFKREARLLSAVEHPAVVRVIDFGESAGAACLIMELVEGDNLYDVLHQGPLPPTRALPLLHQLAEGLAAIHDKGIVHRDLKPENVILTRGTRGEQARLLDFGIARFAESEGPSHLSQVGVVLGTPEYLSPEQAVGAQADARSDLYSFGVLAYHVLAGRLPFDGPSPRQYLAQHAHGTPRPLEEAAPALAPHTPLTSLVMRLLEKEPSHRFHTAQELADALAAANLAIETALWADTTVPLTLASVPWEEQGPGVAAPAPSPSSGTAAFGLSVTSSAPSPSGKTVVFGMEPSPPVDASADPASVPPTDAGTPEAPVNPALHLVRNDGPPVPAEVPPPARGAWARLTEWARARPRQLLVVGAAGALMLGGSAVVVLHQSSPVVQARALLEDGKPAEALRRLQAVPPEARGDAALQRVRARTLHALNRHEEEHTALASLAEDGRAGAEAEVLDALAEDFGESESDRGLRRLLGTFPKDALLEHFENLAEEGASPRQWGALRYLDAEQRTAGLNLRKAYTQGLEAKSCGVRAKAARRLAALGDLDAVPALTKLAEQPKEKTGLFSSKNCGQDEAAAALQALKKKAD